MSKTLAEPIKPVMPMPAFAAPHAACSSAARCLLQPIFTSSPSDRQPKPAAELPLYNQSCVSSSVQPGTA